MIINHLRTYHERHTEGTIMVDGVKFCFALEDIGRPINVKLASVTCIPEGIYSVSITRSTKYGKDMMLLSNKKDGSIERNGVKFTGIRPHGGNSVADSSGCPLLNYHTEGNGKQWGRASDDLFDIVKKKLDDGENVLWIISSY